jgi:ABC-type multidrug transport system ATPase subunit
VIISLNPAGETAFGSAQPEPYTIDDPGTAAKHFTLTPAGQDKLLLRDFGWGNGPYRNGVTVKSDLLEAADYFDFAEHRYTVLSGCTAVERTRLPMVMLVVSGLQAQARKRLFDRRKPKRLLTAMTFVQEKSTVLAVVGGSGAGKSSLLNVLIGDVAATKGGAYFDELDMLGRPAQLRDRLGYVPQDVDLFEALTVNQALEYSFRLRYPGPASRGGLRINDVCGELQLTKQREQLIATLSGGQKRRVSIAIELLSKPDLLILDEPTSGLDPGMDREIMVQLRRYATKERKTVLVTTHNVAHLQGTADNVLVVGDNGRPVFFGAPGTVLDDLDVESYAELMDNLAKSVEDKPSLWSRDQAEAYQRAPGTQQAAQTARGLLTARPARPVQRARRGSVRKFARQLGTLVRRQVTLLLLRSRKMTGPSAWTTAGALQPYLIAAAGAALAASITSGGGLGPHPGRSASTAIGVLTTLTMLSGQALTYSDLVAEFPIIRREHRVGIGIPVIMLAKWLVFAVVAAVQAAIIAAVFIAIKPGPASSNLLPPLIELWADLAVLAVGAMSLGLLISALSAKLEQAVAWVTLASIGQIALNGVTAPLPHFLPWLAFWLPDRWGVSALASSVDLDKITVPAPSPDAQWAHSVSHWLTDLSVAGLLAACYTLLAAYVLWRRLRPAP